MKSKRVAVVMMAAAMAVTVMAFPAKVSAASEGFSLGENNTIRLDGQDLFVGEDGNLYWDGAFASDMVDSLGDYETILNWLRSLNDMSTGPEEKKMTQKELDTLARDIYRHNLSRQYS